MPLVSVIIPSYNAMAYLPETVESVLQQSFKDWELLIVDDGSADHTVSWASELTDPRIRVFSQENQGTPGARNSGLNAANGKFVAFLDSDDIWESKKLEMQIECMESNLSLGLVDTWAVLTDTQGRLLNQVIQSETEGNAILALLERNTVCCGSTPLVRRECFERCGNFSCDLLYVEDWDMWLRLALHYPFGIVRKALVRYRQHPNSKSRNWQKMGLDSLTLLERIRPYLPTQYMPTLDLRLAQINMHLAYCFLQERNEAEASIYHARAAQICPAIYSRLYYHRLGAQIQLLKILGHAMYQNLQTRTSALRKSFNAKKEASR
jgi:glycosyltransferase involved in cell wall biosynthesis